MILCWIKAQDNHVDLQTYEYQGSLSDAVEPEIKPVLTRQLEVHSVNFRSIMVPHQIEKTLPEHGIKPNLKQL